jgi:hypothetical protein
MNANMRRGGSSARTAAIGKVGTAAIKSAIAALLLLTAGQGAFAFGIDPGLADFEPRNIPLDATRHDTQLEGWAKQQVARRMGEIRDSLDAAESVRFITAVDVRRGPLPLGADRLSDPITMMATMRYFDPEQGFFGRPPLVRQAVVSLPPHKARGAYDGAFALASR